MWECPLYRLLLPSGFGTPAKAGLVWSGGRPLGDTVPEVALAEWLRMDQGQVRGNSCGELCPWPLGTVVVTELGSPWVELHLRLSWRGGWC